MMRLQVRFSLAIFNGCRLTTELTLSISQALGKFGDIWIPGILLGDDFFLLDSLGASLRCSLFQFLKGHLLRKLFIGLRLWI